MKTTPERTTPSKSTTPSIQEDENDVSNEKEKQISLTKDDTQRRKFNDDKKPDQNRGSEDKKIEAPFIRELKLTHSKNGRH